MTAGYRNEETEGQATPAFMRIHLAGWAQHRNAVELGLTGRLVDVGFLERHHTSVDVLP